MLFSVNLYTSVLFVCVAVCFAYSNVIHESYAVASGTRITESVTKSRSKIVRSMVECSIICASDTECCTASYNKQTQNCQTDSNCCPEYEMEGGIVAMNKRPTKGWEPIFVACTGNGQAVYQTYLSSDNSTLEITCQDCSRRHLRSQVIDHWNGHMIDEIKLELFRAGKVEKVFVFDGTGSDKTNWFSRQRLVKSSYDDLSGNFTSNFFSMIGPTTVNRHFYINQNHGGCPNDKGWLMVVDTPDVNYQPCKYDKASFCQVDFPYIMYGPKNRRAHWERKGEYKVADKMVISIRTFGYPRN